MTGRPELALCHVRRQAEGGLLRVGERASRTLNYGHLERGLAPSGAQGEKRLSFRMPGLRCFAAAESAPPPWILQPCSRSWKIWPLLPGMTTSNCRILEEEAPHLTLRLSPRNGLLRPLPRRDRREGRVKQGT